MYRYKLAEEAPSKLSSVKQFHVKRMQGFDQIEDLLGQIKPLLDDANNTLCTDASSRCPVYHVVPCTHRSSTIGIYV